MVTGGLTDPVTIPLAADERTTLTAFLAHYRRQFLDRCRRVRDDDLRRPLTGSGLTLARLLTHLAYVERVWFTVRLDGAQLPPPFAGLDWRRDVDAEMTVSDGWAGEDLIALLEQTIEDSDRRLRASGSLDRPTEGVDGNGDHWSLRWILVHLIEEYARHCGHADLLREAVDGDLAD